VITETYRAHLARTGKTQSQFCREINRSPQTLCNLLRRTPDPIVICDAANVPVYVGYYTEYYCRGESAGAASNG
jgi:hypothetical protein